MMKSFCRYFDCQILYNDGQHVGDDYRWRVKCLIKVSHTIYTLISCPSMPLSSRLHPCLAPTKNNTRRQIKIIKYSKIKIFKHSNALNSKHYTTFFFIILREAFIKKNHFLIDIRQ